MLSVRRSRDDGRSGVGMGLEFRGGGGLEVNDIKEGETCSGQDDDRCFNPEVALAYIDEKLQDLLGHFQKDFEGGVSAENLGAKFGEYGTFLPTYQCSPSLRMQPRRPPRGQNQNDSRSLYDSSSEVECQKPQVPTGTSISKNSSALIPHNSVLTSKSVNNSGKISTTKFNTGESGLGHDSINKPANGNYQKPLKIRIKVVPDTSSTRNNAAISSGLGLVISPSSSHEDSSDRCQDLSLKLQHAPNESPTTILQIMTCFSVPGGHLLSPLSDSVLRLAKKGAKNAILKNCRTGILQKGIREKCTVVDNMMTPNKNAKGFIEKKIKPDAKTRRIIEAKGSNSKDGISTILKRRIDNENPEGQKLVSKVLNISNLSGSSSGDLKTEKNIVGNSVKATCSMQYLPKKSNRLARKDRILPPDSGRSYQLESTESIKNNDLNRTTCLRGKPDSNMISKEKPGEEKNISDSQDTSSDMWRDSMVKVDKNYDAASSVFIAYKEKNKKIDVSAESLKPMSAQKSKTSEQDCERILQKKDQIKLKESSGNVPPAIDLKKENMTPVSSATSKEDMGNSRARDDHSKNRSSGLISQKDAGKACSKKSHIVVEGDVNAEQVHHSTGFLETNNKDKPKDPEFENDKRSYTLLDKSNYSPGFKKFDKCPISQAFLDAPGNASLMSNAPSSDAAISSQAPVLIKENWVACDICQEWRLLPYEIDPVHLPEKWHCSMQTWLPGLNKCHIREAVTTEALNALYQNTVPESGAHLNGHPEGDASTITPANVLHFNQTFGHNMPIVPTVGKREHEPKDELLQTSAKRRSLNNASERPSETNSSNKINLENTRKSSDYAIRKHGQRQKENHKNLGRYSGAIIENNNKQSKSKSKREGDRNAFRSSKKCKKEYLDMPIEDRQSKLDVTGQDTLFTGNGFSSSTIGKKSQKYCDYPYSKDLKCDPKRHLPSSIKSEKDEGLAFPSRGLKEHIRASDFEKSKAMGISANKRKMKEWQESQGHQENPASNQNQLDDRVVTNAFSESKIRKQKKAEVSRSEGKEFGMNKVDGVMDNDSSTRILLSGSKEHPHGGKDVVRGIGKVQGSAIFHRSLDCTDFSKSDLFCAQPLSAATSCSSKISGTCRSKANTQEARGTPVESVSSSPSRISYTEKLSTRRNSVGKDAVTTIGFFNTGSPKRCSDGEIDGASYRSGIRKMTDSSFLERLSESQRASETGLQDSFRGTHDFHDNRENHQSRDMKHLKGGLNSDLSSPLFEDKNMESGTGNTRYNKLYCKVSEEHCIPNKDESGNHCHANKPNQQKSSKSSSLCFKDKYRSSKTGVDKGRHRVSDFSREQNESHTTQHVNRYQSEVGIDSYGHYIYHEDWRVENYNAQKKDMRDHLVKKDSTIKWSTGGRKDGHPKYGVRGNLDRNGPSILPEQHEDFDSSVPGASCSKSILQKNLQQAPSLQDEKSSHFISDGIGWSDISSGKEKSQEIEPSKDKQKVQTRDPQAVPILVKGSKLEGCPTDAVNSDVSKVVKQSRKLDNGNDPRQSIPHFPDVSSLVRKDSQSAVTFAYREATNLKDTASRLKGEGLELESTGLYFEAALKFLHVASLLEPLSVNIANFGDAVGSVQLYAQTAGLCEYCAHQYDRRKDMAAAALAYKCVEVAYMKVAYYKHPSASNDQHELQAALQILPPGESPSSSASDIYNLNNQGALDKSALAKGTVSPQIVGSHLIAARNHPNFMRLLNYTNYLNCAFEATRKSRNAIAAAIVNLGKDGVDGISSVKRVLDFSFHNVEGLLRLVRLSMESISP